MEKDKGRRERGEGERGKRDGSQVGGRKRGRRRLQWYVQSIDPSDPSGPSGDSTRGVLITHSPGLAHLKSPPSNSS